MTTNICQADAIADGGVSPVNGRHRLDDGLNVGGCARRHEMADEHVTPGSIKPTQHDDLLADTAILDTVSKTGDEL